MGWPVVPGWPDVGAGDRVRTAVTHGRGCFCGGGGAQGAPKAYGGGSCVCLASGIGGTETQGFGRGLLLCGAGTMECAGSGRGHG